MVVLRVDKNGNLRNSKPCKGCEAIIKEADFKKVWYSTDEGQIVAMV